MNKNLKAQINRVIENKNQKVFIANWKMNKKFSDISEYAKTFNKLLKADPVLKVYHPLIGVAPTMLGILPTTGLMKNNVVTVCQHVHYEKNGAITGQVSYDMIHEYNINYVLIGHSETREMLNVTDCQVNLTIKALLANNMVPVLCIGESIKQYDNNESMNVITSQLTQDLMDVSSEQILNVIIAYEPIWAIGSGKSADEKFISNMTKHIRKTLKGLYDEKVAKKVRVLYGGSVKPTNAAGILKINGVDGALIGGAGLNPNDFYNIINQHPEYLEIKAVISKK